MDFLEHEMRITAFFRRRRIETQLRDFAGDGQVVEVANVHGIGGDDRDVIII